MIVGMRLFFCRFSLKASVWMLEAAARGLHTQNAGESTADGPKVVLGAGWEVV